MITRKSFQILQLFHFQIMAINTQVYPLKWFNSHKKRWIHGKWYSIWSLKDRKAKTKKNLCQVMINSIREIHAILLLILLTLFSFRHLIDILYSHSLFFLERMKKKKSIVSLGSLSHSVILSPMKSFYDANENGKWENFGRAKS